MKRYDFDTPIDRHGTGSIKFDNAEARHRSPDLLSLWVADMDFRTPDEVIEALVARSQHGIFGYTDPDRGYFDAVETWLKSHYAIDVEDDDIVVTPGVVYALATCVRAFTNPEDAVLIQPPVYYPFFSVVVQNGRRLVEVPLAYEDGSYHIDFDAFESALSTERPKLFILCSPHNPVGRVWTPEELERLYELCAEYGTLIISDEIHADFVRPGITYTSLAALHPDNRSGIITCTSASKTFNLAGLQVANIVIPDSQLRHRFKDTMLSGGYSQVNALGLEATRAAYTYGEPWLDQLRSYLEGNWQLLADRLAETDGRLSLIPAEGTYLAWIDCRELGLDPLALERFIEDEAGLWLDCGHIFGKPGEGFIRINIATQRAYLDRAATQLVDAVKRHV